MNQLLSIEEVKAFLDIEEDELEKYLEQSKLHAYKVGGTYIRFRKEDVENLKFQIRSNQPKVPAKHSIFSAAQDFWRFNNFYILSLIFVVAVVFWIVNF